MLAADYEGRQVALWLNSIGVAAFVLKYRLSPRYRYPVALEDAQRALRLIRHQSKRFGVSRTRLGMMGFSAGGHLTSIAGVHFDRGKRLAEDSAEDTIDRQSCRPDFLILAYPVIQSHCENGKHPNWVRGLLGDSPTQ